MLALQGQVSPAPLMNSSTGNDRAERRALARCGLLCADGHARLANLPRFPQHLDVQVRAVRRDSWGTLPRLMVQVRPEYLHVTPLDLSGLARRVRGGLLASVLAELEALCRATRPLLTPAAARTLHEEAFGDEWAMHVLLHDAGYDPGVMTPRQQERALHGLGHVTPGDAGRMYGPRHSTEPLPAQLPFLRGRVRSFCRELAGLRADQRRVLAPLNAHLPLRASRLYRQRYVTLRQKNPDGLATLAERLYDYHREDGYPDLYGQHVPLSPQGVQDLRQALIALHRADTLAALALTRAQQEFPC